MKFVKSLLVLATFCPSLMFAQTENFWTKKADFPGSKRERAVAFSIGNYGYIGTGVDTAEVVLKDFWQYDPVLDTWTQKADLAGVARRDAVGFAIAGKGYIATGIDNDESMSGIKLNDLWEYDPTGNNWVQKANFPGNGGFGIYFATAFSVDSKAYLCCGKVGPSNYSNQLWEYKPSIDQWTQRANFPGGVRYQLSSFSIGYNGYVGLGASEDVFKKDFWKYNPGTNTWSAVSDLPASERGSACTFTLGNRGFVSVGSNGGLLNDLWEYNPTTDQWVVRATFGGSERKNAVAFAINNKGYLGTGKGYTGKKASWYEYTPYNSALGIDELEFSVSIYPNPTTDYINIHWDSQLISTYRLITTEGKLIGSYPSENKKNLKISKDEIGSGIFILVAFDQNNEPISSHKLIVL